MWFCLWLRRMHFKWFCCFRPLHLCAQPWSPFTRLPRENSPWAFGCCIICLHMNLYPEESITFSQVIKSFRSPGHMLLLVQTVVSFRDDLLYIFFPAAELENSVIILNATLNLSEAKNAWEQHSLKPTHINTTPCGQHVLNLNLIFSPHAIISSLSHNALPASSPHPVSSKPRTSQPCFEIRKWKKVSVFGQVRNHSSINTVW